MLEPACWSQHAGNLSVFINENIDECKPLTLTLSEVDCSQSESDRDCL